LEVVFVFEGLLVLAEPVFDPPDPEDPLPPLGAAVVLLLVLAAVPACGAADWLAFALPPPVAFAFWLAFVFWLVLAFVFALLFVFVGANVLL